MGTPRRRTSTPQDRPPSRLERLRVALDAWYGTAARYLGVLLLVYSLLVDHLRNPALLPAAVGLMALKNVAGGKD